MQELGKGQKIKLEHLDFIKVSMSIESKVTIDISCFGVDAQDKLSDDRYFVFYNQKSSPNREIISNPQFGDNETFDIKLKSLPSNITKLVFTATIDGEGDFSIIQNSYIRVFDNTQEIYRFNFDGSFFVKERAIIISEIYIKDNIWRLGCVAQGFNGGLSALLKNFGGEEIKEEINETPKQEDKIKLESKSGKVNLNKDSKPILIKKTPEIIASISWDSSTDYDIYALVYTKNDMQIDVATFGAIGVPVLTDYNNGSVVHMGDTTRDKKSFFNFNKSSQKTKSEVIKIKLNDDILAVVPVAYSAQSNGTGSFYKYQVSMLIDNQDDTLVTVDAINANKDNTIYTCVPGIILNTADGVVIKGLELYSKPGSEKRPKLIRNKNNEIEVIIDGGPVNNYK